MPIDPFFGAALGAAANLGGGIFSSMGQSQANAANLAQQNMINQQMLNAQMATHEQNTGFMEDQQAFNREERQYAENFNAAQAAANRNWQSNEAEHNRSFQMEMANTAYQRAMEDMRKAGLNPILAYQQGGASSPMGGMGGGSSASSPGASSGMASGPGAPSLKAAHVVNDKEALGRAIGNIVNSALETAKGYESVHNIKADTTFKEQAGQHEGQRIEKTIQETYSEKERNKVLQEQQKLLKAETQRAGATTAKALADTALTNEETKSMKEHGSRQAPDTIERLLRALQSHLSSSGTVMPSPPAWDNSPQIFGKDNR